MTVSRRQFLHASVASTLLTSLSGQLSSQAISALGTSGTIPFGARALRAIVLARQFVETLGHTEIGSMHLLLGMAAEAEESASPWLDGIGGSANELRDVCHCLFLAELSESPTSRIDFSDNAHMILSGAQAEALLLQSRSIQPEHILLALIHYGDCTAHAVLEEMWFEDGVIEHEALSALGYPGDEMTA